MRQSRWISHEEEEPPVLCDISSSFQITMADPVRSSRSTENLLPSRRRPSSAAMKMQVWSALQHMLEMLIPLEKKNIYK